MLDKYRLVGPAYDKLSQLYSGNAINDCKLAMLRPDTLGAGSRVLFAGAGQGRDAIHAAALGARVTVVDISPTMIAQCRKNIESHPQRETLAIELIQSDILKIETFGFYDMVVANFFLNVFEREKMTHLFGHLCKLIKPGGKLVIGDFQPPEGNWLRRSVQNAYWYAAATAFFAAAGNAIHQIYDYEAMLRKHALPLKEKQSFSVFGKPFYHALLAEKKA